MSFCKKGTEENEKKIINAQSGRTLEFNQVLDIIAGYAHWGPAADIVRNLHPLDDLEDVHMRQLEMEEAVRLNKDREYNLYTDNLGDVKSFIKASKRHKTLQPAELLSVFHLAQLSRQIGTFLRARSQDYPILSDKALRLGQFRDIEKQVAKAITPDGEISPNATPNLARLRQELAAARASVEERLHDFLRNSEYSRMIQDAVISSRFGRQVIPIKAEYRGHFPGIVIDQSASGATLFMEPLALVELSNLSRTKALAEAAEIERILQSLTELVGANNRSLADSLEELAWLEALQAMAKYADRTHSVLPQIKEKTPMLISSARHPLLIESLGDKVVPMTFDLETNRTLIITGPNTGGKTVALKTIGLMVMMAMSGLPIPADESSCLPFFEQIWAEIGDDQSIMQNLSTFSAHINQVLRMIPHASSHTLLLLDELGAGTDPAEGGALAEAVLEYFHAKGAVTVVTTHLSELKNFASQREGMNNAAVEFDSETLAPTFRVIMGVPGRSNALKIASRLGLPAEIEHRAMELLGGSSMQVEGLLGELDKEREINERLAKRLRDQLSQVGRLRSAYEQKVEKAQQECADMIAKVTKDTAELVESSRRRLRGLTGSVRRRLSQLSSVRRQSIVELRRAASELGHALVNFEALEELVALSPVASDALAKALSETIAYKKDHQTSSLTNTSASTEESSDLYAGSSLSSSSENDRLKLEVALEDIGSYVSETPDQVGNKVSKLDRLDQYVREQAQTTEGYLDDLDAKVKALKNSAPKVPGHVKLNERLKHTAAQALEISLSADPTAAVSESKVIGAKLADELGLEGFSSQEDESLQESEEVKTVNLPLEVGSHVFVPRYGQDGTVLSLSDKKAEVQIGVIRIKVKKEDLQVLAPEEKSEVGSIPRGGSMTMLSSRLDLHGKNVDEALWELGAKIDDAFMSGLHQLEIIHGKGTGTLRKAVTEYIKDHPSVASYRIGKAYEGGIGATIITLNN
ncbi:MAG: endonuclease MutS2 [Candidatus Bruticola sp.]